VLLGGSRVRRLAWLLLPAAFLSAAFLWGRDLERWTLEGRWETFRTGTRLVAPGPVDSRYQNITLARREDEFTVFLDGLAAMSFPNPTALAVDAHFVLCEAKEVRRVLLLGGGLEGLLSEMLRHPVERLDYVTLDPKLVALVRPHLEEAERAALADPRVRVHYDDGRHFLITLGQEGPDGPDKNAAPHPDPLPPKEGEGIQADDAAGYDLIYMDIPEPSSILLNRFYTEEFFELVRKRLAPEGLFAFRLTASPSYFTETRRDYLGSIYEALGRSLPCRLATWGETTYILASASPGVFTTDGAELARRYQSRRVRSGRFQPLWFEGATDMLTPANLDKIRVEISLARTPPNTDGLPRAYLYNLILWDRIVSGREHSPFEYLDRVNLPRALLAAAGAFVLWLAFSLGVLGRSRVESATLFSVATTGLASMSLELVLLVTFQSLYGYVYVRVGIIVGVFMLGLVIGSLVMRRQARRRPDLGPGTLAALDVAIAGFCVLVPAVFLLLNRLTSAGQFTWAVEWCILTLVLMSGVLGGGIIPLSANLVEREGKETGRTAGSVDAADHVGACIGALVTGVVLIPAIGIPLTCLVLCLLKGLSALFLALTGRSLTRSARPL
jgi:spermidine synthase